MNVTHLIIISKSVNFNTIFSPLNGLAQHDPHHLFNKLVILDWHKHDSIQSSYVALIRTQPISTHLKL